MSVRDLIPWARETRASAPPSRTREEASPFLTLHRAMNRLFDEMLGRFDVGWPAPVTGGLGWPRVEMTEANGVLRISAELPGPEEKDVELFVDDDTIVIRGEKRAEREENECGYSERSYGRFERVITLPFAVEEEKAEASFKNGVLSVTLPRSSKTLERGRRIAINGSAPDGAVP